MRPRRYISGILSIGPRLMTEGYETGSGHRYPVPNFMLCHPLKVRTT